MESLVLIFVVAFAGSLLLTAVVRVVARRWGIVDRPDGKRKLHPMPVPLWGGVAVYLTVVLGLLAANLGLLGITGGEPTELSTLSTVLIVAAGIVCFFGSVDDYWTLSSRVKLLLQICSVLPIVAFGYYVDRIVAFGYPIELGWIGIPLTVAWLVGCINALNLLDGMDGLASTVGLLTAAMMAIIAVTMGNGHVAVIAIVLAGALGGFLVYNLPPASIFLGDSGSMVVGLVLGVLGIQGAMKTSATLAITVPAVIMSLPMFDMMLALVRRKLTGKRIDAADREHVHHRLLERGLTQWQALCIIGALCLTTGAAATAATILRMDALAWITALGLLVLAIRMRVFGHHELALAKRAVARKLADWAHRLSTPGSSRSPSNGAELARLPFEKAWEVLVDEVKAWEVCRLELILAEEGEDARRYDWAEPVPDADQQRCWSITLAFREQGQQVCELRATGFGAMESETLCSAALSRELLMFGTYFAKSADKVRAMTPFGEERASSQHDHKQRSRAA